MRFPFFREGVLCVKYPWVEEYLLSKPGVSDNWQTDWNWHRFYVGEKFFAALCCRWEDGEPSLITVKLPPDEGELLRGQYEDVIPGYYMNKVHWNSVRADGNVPDDVLRVIMDHAWQTGFQSLTKKKQQQIIQAKEGGATV